MALAGPRVQMPSGALVLEGGEATIETSALLNMLQSIAFYSTRSGTTANRPTSTSFRWVGMHYFDTTLGLPVFLKTASSSAWVKADGTAA